MSSVTPQLCVLTPVFNELGNVRPLVEEVEQVLTGQLRFEIIVIDDASTDGTAAELAALRSARDNLRVETHALNRGQSAAIRTGVKSCRAPVIAMLDGDGQNDPADIPALFAALNASSDVMMVVGERRRRQDSWVRRLSSRLANSVRSWLLDDGIKDTGCGLKVFYRDKFLELPAFDHMHRYLPALTQHQRGRVLSMPVNHRPRRCGSSKYGVSNRLWVGVIDLLGVRWLGKRRL